MIKVIFVNGTDTDLKYKGPSLKTLRLFQRSQPRDYSQHETLR